MASSIVSIAVGGGGAGGVVTYLEEPEAAQGKVGYYAPGSIWLVSRETHALLGLKGARAERAEMVALMEGRHPGTGETIRPAGTDSRTGEKVHTVHDLTLSPMPKSGSVIWALASPGEQAALERGLKEVVAK